MTKVALKGPVNGTGSYTLSAPETASTLELELPTAGSHLASAGADGMPLGTGGDPVVASGVNSDGSWIKWADGTMKCHNTIGSSSGGAATWAFPSAFINQPSMSGAVGAPASARVLTRGAVTGTTTEFFVWNTSGVLQTNSVDLSATGRWK